MDLCIILGHLIKLCGVRMGKWVEEEAKKKRKDRAGHHQGSELRAQKGGNVWGVV